MHVYFSGIGGAGIGPLALIAKQAGYDVSGSDKQKSSYIDYLKKHGVKNIKVGQDGSQIAAAHARKPIDWFVYSSAVEKEDPSHPEIKFARKNKIRISKRDEFTNQIISDKNLKLIAVAGTHGKTTTTSMVIWLFKELGIPISYSVGAKTSFAEMGQYEPGSEYFVYECDEFDRNFLAFQPNLSLICGVTYDHHEIYPTKADYQQAFRDFIDQSGWSILWQREYDYLKLRLSKHYSVLSPHGMPKIALPGKFNREDAWLAVQGLASITKESREKLLEIIDRFPGLQRRMEQIVPGLYSDYAHTPEKIQGAMSVALEMADDKNVVVVYEPLTNRRQHYMMGEYKDSFKGAKKVYWIPSYLAREDPDQKVLTPAELITHLADPSIAEPMARDEKLKKAIKEHLKNGDMVVVMAGGGGDSLDDWIRIEFA